MAEALKWYSWRRTTFSGLAVVVGVLVAWQYAGLQYAAIFVVGWLIGTYLHRRLRRV